MAFHGWAYALEEYARTLEAAGLLIEAIREPLPAATGDALDPADERWRRIPMSSCSAPGSRAMCHIAQDRGGTKLQLVPICRGSKHHCLHTKTGGRVC